MLYPSGARAETEAVEELCARAAADPAALPDVLDLLERRPTVRSHVLGDRLSAADLEVRAALVHLADSPVIPAANQ